MEPCAPAFVVANNQSSPNYSELAIDVQDYPGLLRVITWVMNGLGIRVHNAVLKTDDEGMAHDVFWVTDLRGRKLSEAAAADAADRLEEFVSYCAPPSDNGDFTAYSCGDIAISNLTHPKWTEVTVNANIFSPGLLFEMASIFHGQGLVVHEGVVRGGSDNPIPGQLLEGMDLAAVPEPAAGQRVMRFWIKEAKKDGKLDFADVSALLYTLRVVLGDGGLPTRPPNMELNSLTCECSEADEPSSNGGMAAARSASTAKGRVTLA